MDSITIRDVAHKANVSIKTVSRVVNDLPQVSEGTKERVWKVIDDLHYVPSETGRQLSLSKNAKKAKTGNIGCLLFSTYNKYSEPFFSELLEEVDRVLMEFQLHNYCTYTLSELENKSLFLRRINANCLDGCIVIGMGEMQRDQIMRIKERVHHVVILSDYLKDGGFSSVYPDGFQSGYLATRHLAALGHKRIGCITGFLNWHGYTQSRFNGYKKALQDSGLPFDAALVVEGKYSIETAALATEALLQNKPRISAIFSASDPMAMGIYKALHRNNLKIPDDISVASCDNISLSDHFCPPLTTIDVHKREMARKAVQILCEEMEGRRSTPVEVVLPVNVIYRESCKNFRQDV